MIRLKQAALESGVSAWVPTVEMVSARPAVFRLAMAPTLNDAQTRSAIAEFVRLSERPPAAQAGRLIPNEPEVMARPWAWLYAVMRDAHGSGDYHLAAAGLQWACHWRPGRFTLAC
jgi:hypothetical protein